MNPDFVVPGNGKSGLAYWATTAQRLPPVKKTMRKFRPSLSPELCARLKSMSRSERREFSERVMRYTAEFAGVTVVPKHGVRRTMGATVQVSLTADAKTVDKFLNYCAANRKTAGAVFEFAARALLGMNAEKVEMSRKATTQTTTTTTTTTKATTQTITVDVDGEMFRQAAVAAAKRNRLFSDVIVEAVKRIAEEG